MGFGGSVSAMIKNLKEKDEFSFVEISEEKLEQVKVKIRLKTKRKNRIQLISAIIGFAVFILLLKIIFK
jgi:hypothetical protein